MDTFSIPPALNACHRKIGLGNEFGEILGDKFCGTLSDKFIDLGDK